MTEATEHFVAALVEALPPMISILCPTYNGLKRLEPSASVGAHIGWGLENKEAPLRILPNQHNFELKTMDHTANHYYVLATIMNLGLLGIKEKKPLPEPLATTGPTYLLRRLPSKWDEVKAYLESEAGTFFKRALGE